MKKNIPRATGESNEVFAFSEKNKSVAKKVIEKYPEGQAASALLPLLDLAQRQNDNWLPKGAIRYVAKLLDVPETRAFEVASFYTMFRLKPRGKFLIQMCKTTPCWLRGSDSIRDALKNYLEIEVEETSKDNAFTLVEVECLGACVNAPVVQINDQFYEDLTCEKMLSILKSLKSGPKDKETRLP
tara:strand:+ start:179 stop:733 length:555 start_codon:yes stop_codon:yes gene_type:complete